MRTLHFAIAAWVAVAASACSKPFAVEEATVAQIHVAMEEGRLTAEELVIAYLARIAAYDKDGPSVNALITVNQQAVERARELDRTFATSGFVGPLHGIPVIVKDNYDTHDLPTTNGTLAFKGKVPPDDAFQVARLREAGAIILAKSNLAEFAQSGAFTVSSVLPGYSRNPYDTRRVTAGSSGGTAAAVASNFGTVGLGTDTGSSIRGPAAHQSLVGFRTTMGLSSRDGIAPLNMARDVGGPIARTVEDAVRVLDVIVGVDEADPVTELSEGHVPPGGYRQFLDPSGLEGARIGVLREFFEVEDAQEDGPRPSPREEATAEDDADEQADPPEPKPVHPEVNRLLNEALRDMAAAGAIIVDSVAIPNLDSLRRAVPNIRRFRYDFERYLESRPELGFDSLPELIATGDYHPYLQASLQRSREEDPRDPEEDPEWEAFLAGTEALRQGVIDAMDAAGVDVLVYPTYNYPPRLIGDMSTIYGANSGTISPPTGFPAFNVPMGFSFGTLPAGMQLLGRPFAEPVMIRIAYGYEQATKHRRPPASTPPIR